MTTAPSPLAGQELQLRMDAIERQLPVEKPLVPLKVVMFYLKRDEDGVRYLYESGLLRFAFDIGDAGAKRKEVRIYRESVEEYLLKDYSQIDSRKANDARDLAAAIRASLPAGRTFTVSKLKDLWTVSSTHLHDLADAGEISVVPGQSLHVKESPALLRESVAEFLLRRRIV